MSMFNTLPAITSRGESPKIQDLSNSSGLYIVDFVIANKFDVNGAPKRFKQLERFIEGRFRVIPISCKTSFGLKKLGPMLFDSLEIIRVYTKEPGSKDPSPTPFILKKDSAVAELAKQIHSDFYKRFSFAKVWSKRLSFSPQKVGLSFKLDDKDIVEMHAQ